MLNKQDYISKMELILNDSSKFCKIGPLDSCDGTRKKETKTFEGESDSALSFLDVLIEP